MPIPDRKQIRQDLLVLLSTQKQMQTKDVYSSLADIWHLSSNDRKIVRNSNLLYQHEIRWAKQELVIEGKILRNHISGRSIWRLSSNLVTPTEYENQESDKTFIEGKSIRIFVNVYERSAKARKLCLAHHGYSCAICGFNFESTYGEVGKECIHVHHLVELSSIGAEYEIDPIKDLVPLCANCHYMIHRRRPAFSVEEIKALLSRPSSPSLT